MNRKFIKNSNSVLRKVIHSNYGLEIIKDFIENFLKIQIQSISINDCPIVNGKKSKEYGIVDVRITTKENEEINVGIQVIDGDYIQNKMFLYYAKIHSNQVLYNDGRRIAKTITINILDEAYFSSAEYHKVIKIKTNIINDNILETMELHVLELPKFKKEYSKSISNEEAWMFFLKENDQQIINELTTKNLQIKKLNDLIEHYWKKEKIVR